MTTENMTLQARAFSADGKAKAAITLPEALFDGTVNVPVMHQVVKATLANQRQGTASTKTRGKVVGGNQKPWKQKGTGRARQGSTRAPHWPGGGTVFGPTPRDYTQRVQKKVRTLGKKSALNVRARENDLLVIDSFEMKAPSTKAMLGLLGKLGVADKKVLFLTDGVKPMTFLSARNIPSTHVMPYQDVGTYHVLWSDVVIIEASALTAQTAAAAEAK
jgi:large subunit ribosomal protein L4